MSLTLPNGRFSLHSVLFLVFNCFYFVPILGVMIFNYSEGGTSKAADLDFDVMSKITFVYVLGIAGFLIGSRLGSFLTLSENQHGTRSALRLFVLSRRFKVLCGATVGLFLVSKLILIGLGVYSEYAFSTDSMVGGAWSFSMFCSELLLLLSMVVLFSSARRNVLWFLIFTGVNGINLLHGTRVFFVIAAIVFGLFLYVQRKLSFRLVIVGLGSLLFVGYAIFLLRSHEEADDQTMSVTRLVSPIMFEGVFSQISLIGTIRHPEAWNISGSPIHFFLDALYFVTPRFLLPEKDQLLFTDQFSDLSPLGAFSGYAQGLIYFGAFFPVFYLTLGYIAAWLQRRAGDSQLWSVIYVYFVCDFLFRIMRDGYVIPIKMLLDSLVVMLFVVGSRNRQVRGKFAPSLAQDPGNSLQTGNS